MPTPPVANFVVRKPRLAFTTLDRFLDAMCGQRDSSELFQGRLHGRVREIEVILGHFVPIQRTNHDQRFLVLHQALFAAGSLITVLDSA